MNDDEGARAAPLREQLSMAILDAMTAAGVSQADLAAEMGLTTKHMNHLVNGKSGALGMYDYAAFTLGKKWEVRLV